MEEKIKSIYNCNEIEGNDPLVIWHNQVIEKCESEMTISDVARCIRQNLFLKSAYEMLLVYLMHNPYEGDAYEGELMEKASLMDEEFIANHRSVVSKIVRDAYRFIENNYWEFEDDKLEFKESVNELAEKLKD